MFKVEHGWPRRDIINAITMLLRFNALRFGSAYYRQKEGEAMGIPFT